MGSGLARRWSSAEHGRRVRVSARAGHPLGGRGPARHRGDGRALRRVDPAWLRPRRGVHADRHGDRRHGDDPLPVPGHVPGSNAVAECGRRLDRGMQ